MPWQQVIGLQDHRRTGIAKLPEYRELELNGTRIVLVDSITETRSQDAGAIVISGSHGGISAAYYAAKVQALLYVFNDAGIGADDAGVAGLAVLGAAGIAAVAVSHESARIGEASDILARGVVSRMNSQASDMGFKTGRPLRDELARLFEISV